MEQLYFRWPDYLVLCIILALSAVIGFYYAFTGNKQSTTKEYLLAGKKMHWFPVACSLVASFVSSTTLIGLPGEVYTFGTIILYSFLFKPFGVLIAVKLFLPIYARLGGMSMFRYIEKRFGRVVKYMMLVIAILQGLVFGSLVVYGPALSISAVTGANIWLAILSVTLISILYTVMGGLKAVMWTDTLQLLIMIGGVFVVLIYGTVKAGGIGVIWEASRLSGRLDMLEAHKVFDVDPRARHTIWGLALHGIVLYASAYGCSQTSFQRFMALEESKSSKLLVFWMTGAFSSLIGICCGLVGLVIFYHNRYCDPISDGQLFSIDQLYPRYVMQLMGNLPGLPGFILSAILSASLSSLSSSMSGLTAVILQDFIRPFTPNMSDKKATIVSKFVTLGLGGILMALVLVAMNVGAGLFTTAFALGAMFGAPTVAVFAVGVFLPIVNQLGAIFGYISGAGFGAWMGFGGLTAMPFIYRYPVSTAGCNVTNVNLLTNLTSPVYDPSTWNPQSHYRSGLNGFYDISYTWIGILDMLVTVIASIVFSHIINLIKKDTEKVDSKLLSPLLTHAYCFMPKMWRDRINFNDCDEEFTDESNKSTKKESVEVLSESSEVTNSKL